MPKGQSPASLMKARYEMLSKQLENTPKDYSAFSKIRRMVKQFVRKGATDDKQHAVNPKYRSLLKKVEKIEANMRRQGAMADKVKKAQTP